MAKDPSAIDVLRAENQELRGQLDQLQQVLGQRSINTVGEVVDGIQMLIQASRAGNQNSRGLLQQLHNALEGVSVASSVLTPNGGGKIVHL